MIYVDNNAPFPKGELIAIGDTLAVVQSRGSDAKGEWITVAPPPSVITQAK